MDVVRRSHRYSLACLLGGGLIVLAGLTGSRSSRTPEAGFLVAERPSLSWRVPEPGSTDPAAAHYVLRNEGGAPVHVRSARSSCGCSTPRVHPEVIEPGGSAAVDVEATAPDIGERLVHITLETDSARSPEVRLELRLIGGRKPPYLESLRGDLTYFDVRFEGTEREVQAFTVESDGAGRTPVARVDLPFLEVRPDGAFDMPAEGGFVKRRHRFQVRFASEPPVGDFTGELSVADPWNPSRVERLSIHGKRRPAVEVYPSRIVLRLDGPPDEEAKASFTVRTPAQEPELTVEVAGAASEFLRVERRRTDLGEGLARFDLLAKHPGPSAPSEAELVVRRGSGQLGAVIPVLIKGKP